MADVRPFRGLRYHSRIGALEAVLTPPPISLPEREQRALYQRCPYNVGRIEFGELRAGDRSVQDRADRMGALFREWLESGVLVPDERPAFYLLRQRFPFRGETRERFGLTAGVRLEDYERRIVLPHEATIEFLKQDRLALLGASRANPRPLMALYRDESGVVREIVAAAAAAPPELEVELQEVNYALWRIGDEKRCAAIRRALEPEPLVIADGHHRYETGLAFRDLAAREEGGDPADERAVNFISMTLIELSDPGLLILPYHRVLHGMDGVTAIVLQEFMEKLFDFHPLPRPGANGTEALVEALEGGGPGGCEGAIRLGLLAGRGRRPCLLELKRDMGPVLDAANPLEGCDPWFLQEHVLRPVLGEALPHHVGYVHDADEAVARVTSEESQMAFFLRPIPVALFAEIARRGLRLPPKATYVYPKMPAGIVIQRLVGTL
jgi:uncharacterized protein (DUF1015 family)